MTLTLAGSNVRASEESEAVAIGALGGANLSATIGALVPEPLTALVAEGVSFTSNLALKGLNAAMIQPGDRTRTPNSSDQCTFDFDLPQSHTLYSNIYGIPTSPIPGNWGELGAPDVVHWSTEVIVSANNRYIPEGQNVRVRLPAGQHTIDWRAETLIDPGFDVALPAAMLAMSYSKFKAAKTAPAAVAGNADAVAKEANIFKRAGKWMVAKLKLGVQKCKEKCASVVGKKALIYIGDQLTGWETVSRTKVKEQKFTVYDVLDPVIRYQGANQVPGAVMPMLTLEATDIGGVLLSRVRNQLNSTVSAFDPCGRTAYLGSDLPDLIPIGSNLITWTARDAGPTVSGNPNSVQAFQTILVEDTQAPIMVTPPGRVIEVDPAGPNGTGLSDADIVLGTPRVVDLADPAPSVFSDAPAFFPVDSRTPVLWTAQDHSDNASTGTQLITVKTLGTNTAPVVQDIFATTLTSDPVDIVLRGVDNDELDGVFDPLSFRIPNRPANGDFVAPLLPFFIEDFRTAVAGPYGTDFANAGNKPNWLYDNVCQGSSLPYNERIPLDWVYAPRFVYVEDDGTYLLIDSYWRCGASSASTYPRISKWDKDNNYLGQVDYGGTTDAFVVDQDGYIYVVSRTGSGSSSTLRLVQVRPNLEDPTVTDRFGDSWRFDYASTDNRNTGVQDPVAPESLSYARVDSSAGLLYVTDRRRVFVFDVRDQLSNGVDDSDNSMGDRYLGALEGGQQFLCTRGSSYGNSWTGFTMEVDSTGALYVTDSCDNRIHKFEPSGFDAEGTFHMGEHVGWLGRCESSTNNACDVVNQRSRGYTCTDATCQVSDYYQNDAGLNVNGSQGTDPGQFATPRYIDLDPNDVLYVADAGRVQRFTPDGTFGGEARSTGTGINQGERPGFILGNLGTVKAVTVNSTNFFVVDQQESFIHVFQTTPLKDITDSSATVSYVSNFNFHGGVDTFTYRASDGLADSNLGTVSIQVNRNYRPPEAFPQSLALDEDTTLAIELTGDDPDGVIGTDDVYPLDTLSFLIVGQPQHGSLSGSGANRTYTPNPDFNGEDAFTFVANDGRFNSPPATVSITVNPVDDAPRMRSVKMPTRVGAGFPFTLTADYSDDGSAVPTDAVVDWGDSQDGVGDFVDPDGEAGPQPATLVGVKVIEPPLRDGQGNLFSKHAYTQTGIQDVVVCVSDDQDSDCSTQSVAVDRVVNLDVQVSDDPVETTGSYLDMSVTVENMVPQGIAGLTASNVSLTQPDVPEIRIASIVSQSGACSLSAGKLICADASMAPGETFNATVRLVRSETAPLIYDLGAPFAVDVSTTSDALQDTYPVARWVTFLADPTDTDGDGMPDVFEQTYGFNVASPADAAQDRDGDGLTNLEEFERRSNPLLVDTDGDGVWDANDFCPEDPGGSVEGTDGVCEAEIRRSPVLRIIEIMGHSGAG
ncbi:MAG: Ig-like domain-containing protein [Pseudomonadales bacterium]